jgi:hypothetical protein
VGNRELPVTFFYIGLSGFSGENGSITSLKNVPNRPFWKEDLRFYGRMDVEVEKGGFGDAGF